MTSDSAPARSGRRRGRAVAIVVIAALVLVYVVVVALYALNERFANIEGCTEEPPSDAVLLSVTPESVNAAGDRIVANLTVLSFGPVGSEDTSLLSEPLTILVSGTDGPRSFTIAPGRDPVAAVAQLHHRRLRRALAVRLAQRRCRDRLAPGRGR